ncbi:cytochrome P450 [Stereum hirsutum FP-91666 SS1]|uniref:cytochrome P450 n=1 Tax=Stereum hirsutum (strain FP-91666) TaxID=721885 RepID=UPI0004449AE8|nr:cytochrome P450 [Stereum hirsutum FP-91666 SS1]EIM82087.1 cytochrome P450 [Stereum hirsutum FP-91666 SS1]
MGYLPGLRSLFTPISPFGALLPTVRWNPGLSWQWRWRNTVYERAGVETISVLAYLFGRPSIYTCSIEVAKQVVATKGQFEKPLDTSQIVLLWGPNIFAANGEVWRRHRSIMAPSFTANTYSYVWNETLRAFREIDAYEWEGKDEIMLPAVNDITNKFALVIISRCGFGNPLPWKELTSASGEMTFAEALMIVSNSSIIRLVTPRWMYGLPIRRLHEVETAYTTFGRFIKSLIHTRRQELSDGIIKGDETFQDVFRRMLEASETEGRLAMTDDELAGNTFLMMFAGHETTARTLDATIGFLALYQDIQEEVYQEIVNAVTVDPELNFTSMSSLVKVQACFLEAARLFPAGFMMIRDTTEDLVLTTTNKQGEEIPLPLSKGTRLVIDVVGMHYNPRHFPDPEEFRPHRWYNAKENDMSMFSFGPRACIGRRFALTEAVCFLAQLLREWKVDVVLNKGESRAQWRKRVMTEVTTMSLGVGPVPVKLIRRARE